MQCERNNQKGHKWGPSGFCYTGPNSKELAARQGRAIEANEDKGKKS